MLKKFFFLLGIVMTGAICSHTVLPIIIQIKSFKQISLPRLFNHPSQHRLVIVDVDNTLVRPTDGVLAHGYRCILTPEQRRILCQQADRPLIQPCSISIIESIKRQGIPVIACTALRIDFTTPEFLPHVWRYEHLRSLNFSGSFHEREFELSPREGRKPLFYRGILFSDALKKGPIVESFLSTMHYCPGVIAMIDDSFAQLQSVETMCAEHNIEFHGYHYIRSASIVYDEKLAKFQIGYLQNFHRWLSDAQARKSLERIALFINA